MYLEAFAVVVQQCAQIDHYAQQRLRQHSGSSMFQYHGASQAVSLLPMPQAKSFRFRCHGRGCTYPSILLCCGHNVPNVRSDGLSAVDKQWVYLVWFVGTFVVEFLYATAEAHGTSLRRPQRCCRRRCYAGVGGRGNSTAQIFCSQMRLLYDAHLHLPLLALVELSLQLQRHGHQRSRCCCSTH